MGDYTKTYSRNITRQIQSIPTEIKLNKIRNKIPSPSTSVCHPKINEFVRHMKSRTLKLLMIGENLHHQHRITFQPQAMVFFLSCYSNSTSNTKNFCIYSCFHSSIVSKISKRSSRFIPKQPPTRSKTRCAMSSTINIARHTMTRRR